MNKNDMQWTEEEKQKIEAALAEAQEKNQIVLLVSAVGGRPINGSMK